MNMRLPCDATSPRIARAFIQGVLAHHGDAELGETATLLVSELVTNAYLHASSSVDIDVHCCPGHRVAVAVKDTCTEPAAVADPTERDGTTGRGLLLIDALADDWGNHITSDGKTVWFRLQRSPADS